MRRLARCRSAVTMSVALWVAAVALTTGAPPATAAGPVRVLQFNICGAMCNAGVIGKVGAGKDIVDVVRSRIVGFKPQIVTLNEVCAGQYNRLRSVLGGGPWGMRGAFRAQRNDPRCQGGNGFGDAVFTAAGINGQRVLPLPNPPGGPEHRAVLCLDTSVGGGPVLACVLHTVTDDPMKSSQVAAAARAANAAAGRGAVILGGDFNLTPSGMGALLDPGKGGRFFDADPERAPTRGQKIDYVLFDRGHFTNPSGGPQGSPFSDHAALLGRANRL